MDYRLILILVLVLVLVSLCLDCAFKEKFQAEIERVTTSSISNKVSNKVSDKETDDAYDYDEVSPINTIDDIVNLYPIIEGENTTSNDDNENKKQRNKVPTQTVGVTHIFQSDYSKPDPIGFDGINNYTRALKW